MTRTHAARSGPAMALVCAGVALLATAPALLSPGLLNAAIQMLIAALFASAYNVVCGQAGMLSFGHAAYFGVGAFATIHAMNAVGGTGLLQVLVADLAAGTWQVAGPVRTRAEVSEEAGVLYFRGPAGTYRLSRLEA